MKLSYRYLIDPIETRQVLRTLVVGDVIGLDTETYFESESRSAQLSLVQIATSSGQLLVVDALAAGIGAVRELIESDTVVKVAHNARFDQGSLELAGFSPRALLDTLRLSRRTLDLKSFSLASVAEHLLGLKVDKSLQKSNWSRRPLDRAQLDYAAFDARLVLDVYREIERRLLSDGRFDDERDRARLDWKKPQKSPGGVPRAGFVRPPTAVERKRGQVVS